MKKSKLKISWPNNINTYAKDGDDWFLIAKKAGMEIPTGCLTGSCGACEIDVNGETVRPCISNISMKSIKNKGENIVKVCFTTDPFWQ